MDQRPEQTSELGPMRRLIVEIESVLYGAMDSASRLFTDDAGYGDHDPLTRNE